jgi:hypothetical protein
VIVTKAKEGRGRELWKEKVSQRVRQETSQNWGTMNPILCSSKSFQVSPCNLSRRRIQDAMHPDVMMCGMSKV